MVRTDQRQAVDVGDGGEKSGSNARLWRSLDVDQSDDVEPAERGQQDTCSEEDCRDGRSGVIRKISRRQKTRYGGFEYFPHPRGLLGSGHCDRALLPRYPLSLGTPYIRECEPG
jgi:hypothetical protein